MSQIAISTNRAAIYSSDEQKSRHRCASRNTLIFEGQHLAKPNIYRGRDTSISVLCEWLCTVTDSEMPGDHRRDPVVSSRLPWERLPVVPSTSPFRGLAIKHQQWYSAMVLVSLFPAFSLWNVIFISQT